MTQSKYPHPHPPKVSIIYTSIIPLFPGSSSFSLLHISCFFLCTTLRGPTLEFPCITHCGKEAYTYLFVCSLVWHGMLVAQRFHLAIALHTESVHTANTGKIRYQQIQSQTFANASICKEVPELKITQLSLSSSGYSKKVRLPLWTNRLSRSCGTWAQSQPSS